MTIIAFHILCRFAKRVNRDNGSALCLQYAALYGPERVSRSGQFVKLPQAHLSDCCHRAVDRAAAKSFYNRVPIQWVLLLVCWPKIRARNGAITLPLNSHSILFQQVLNRG